METTILNRQEIDTILRSVKKLSRKEDKIEIFKNAFYKKTTNGYIFDNLNGFLALGVLKKPSDYITKEVNTMWFLVLVLVKQKMRL